MANQGLFQRFRQAVKIFREGSPVSYPDPDEYLWTSALSKGTNDLSPMKQAKMQELALYLYDTNPICGRLIDMTAEYIVSEGWKVEATSKKTQEVIDDFWKNPINNLDYNLIQFVKELCIYGEQCYQMFVNLDGTCLIGYINPQVINSVILTSNPLIVSKVGYTDSGVQKFYDCVVYHEAGKTFNGLPFSGDTFFFKTNSVLSATRGRSDLLRVFDISDLYDQYIFSRGDRSILGNTVLHDLTVQGANKQTCSEIAKEFGKVSPNQTWVHNETVKYDVHAPDLKAEDSSFDNRTIKNYILGALGFPEHFFGEGGNVNRATALEMHEPVVRRLKTKQRFVKGMFHQVIDFVLYQSKKLAPSEDRSYQIYFPEISYRDMERSGLTMMYLAQSLAIAVEAGWVTNEEAGRLYAAVAAGFGPDISSRGKEKANE